MRQLASPRENDTPPRPIRGYIFPKPRCARQVDHSMRQGAVRCACKPMNKVTTLRNRSLFGPMCFVLAAAMPSFLEPRHRQDRAAMRAGKGGSGAYIAEWRRVSEMIESDINDDDYLEEEIKNIQNSYTDDDLKHLIRNHGENRSH